MPAAAMPYDRHLAKSIYEMLKLKDESQAVILKCKKERNCDWIQ